MALRPLQGQSLASGNAPLGAVLRAAPRYPRSLNHRWTFAALRRWATQPRTLTSRAIRVPNFSPPKPLQNNEQSLTTYPKSEKRRSTLRFSEDSPSSSGPQTGSKDREQRSRPAQGREPPDFVASLKRNRTVFVQATSRAGEKREDPALARRAPRRPEFSGQPPAALIDRVHSCSYIIRCSWPRSLPAPLLPVRIG
jgi:hypothetical protein